VTERQAKFPTSPQIDGVIACAAVEQEGARSFIVHINGDEDELLEEFERNRENGDDLGRRRMRPYGRGSELISFEP